MCPVKRQPVLTVTPGATRSTSVESGERCLVQGVIRATSHPAGAPAEERDNGIVAAFRHRDDLAPGALLGR